MEYKKPDVIPVNSGKNLYFLFFFLVLIHNLAAVNFSGLNLSNDDRLFFKAEFEGQSTVFLSRLTDMSMQQITAFPEKMYLVDNGRTILSLSRFGAVRIPVSGGLPVPLPGYPSFTQGDIPLKGRLQDIAASPDGRWILYVEPVSPGYGNLLLIDILNGNQRVVSERIELPGIDFPAKWSHDSRLFVYSKGGRIIYFPIIDDLSLLIDERFRIIGSGGINSVLWGQRGDFYYISENILYRVINPELFSRTIYGDFLSIGDVTAVLPYNFDPGFDRFWIAPDSSSVLIKKGENSFFFYLLGENRNNTAAEPVILPYVLIPYGAENFNVLWPAAGHLTITYSIGNQTNVLRFETSRNNISLLTSRTSPLSPNGALSPDGTRAVFWGENGLELWDYTEWRLIQRLINIPVYSCIWLNNRQFITGNERFIEEINITGAYSRRRISLSGADEFGFDDTMRGSSRLLARAGNEWFANEGSAWVAASNVRLRPVSLSSDRFRVFLEPQTTGHFRNVIMLRNMFSTSTVSLFSRHTVNNVFAMGTPAQIALCFDLYDDDTGLQHILSSLRRFNIRATFFLNGEFIRRNPFAAIAIAEAGHETASMFFAQIDFSDVRYRVTSDFVSQGLARNEDEFHHATGRELSILWHPPFYRSSALVNAAAVSSGYISVDRSIDPGDWISREDTIRLNLRQIPPAEMIDQIMEKIEGRSIVPIRIGKLSGGRDEYLYQRIDVLLDALIRRGYEIVPVSTVISR